MKIVLTDWCTDWKGKEAQPIKPVILELLQERHLMFLIISLGNGNFEEACFEVDSSEAYERVRGALAGTGGAERVKRTSKAESCRLFRDGYEIYTQYESSFIFLNPTPRPELFSSTTALEAYSREFSNPAGQS